MRTPQEIRDFSDTMVELANAIQKSPPELQWRLQKCFDDCMSAWQICGPENLARTMLESGEIRIAVIISVKHTFGFDLKTSVNIVDKTIGELYNMDVTMAGIDPELARDKANNV